MQEEIVPTLAIHQSFQQVLRLAVSVSLISAGVDNGAAAQTVPVDTAGLLVAALEAYQTPNGPIIEIAATLRCREPSARDGPGREYRCSTPAVDSMIQAYARRHHLRVASEGAPIPQCRWSPAAVERKGLLVELQAPQTYEKTLVVGLSVTCIGYSRSPERQFFEIVFWEVIYGEGRWKLGAILFTLVT
jgi:hypothetical protein